MTWIHHTKVDRNDWPAPNFPPEEIACRRSGMVLVTPASMEALRRLQRLRTAMGHALYVNSGHRTPAHNATLKGAAKNSFHMRGVAFDISMANADPHEFERQARLAGFTGIGIYVVDNFIHIDTRADLGARAWRGIQQGGEFPARDTRFAPEVRPRPVAETVRDVGLPAVGAGGAVAVALEQAEPVLREVAPVLPDRLQAYAYAAIAAVALAVILLRLVRHARAKRAEGDAE